MRADSRAVTGLSLLAAMLPAMYGRRVLSLSLLLGGPMGVGAVAGFLLLRPHAALALTAVPPLGAGLTVVFC
ncbi:MAG: hypothetical protein AAF628_21080 [Planctomycetota bacterium]